ncbi:hypothetical protein HQ865_18915 [Mucilaginibacter mali]|uniref:Uncharacterized protein n=1 Tax=Mucilaginibacter mali TaxID=2740462 RepID=A0A7D4QA58_9SPHI|nr:hypothetical protein [Mucilaginibacter mali]QKJ31751.1 hypothetical protein HQ865_18915 [Mucilaginibacter mali]
MSRAHSFLITVSNNLTEKEGINYLIEHHTGFFKIDRSFKKELLDALALNHKFLNAFDMIYIPEYVGKVIGDGFIEANLESIILIELKTTKKYLPNNPKGFFFGATENEFKFGELLGEKFRFCFVCLNEQSLSYSLMSVPELEQIIRTRRIQFQINL